MRQTWHDLLFAHWPVSVAALRPLVPAPLELDTFGGEAWLGVVPFRMSGVRMRFLPALPGLSAFPELNVRTYVKLGEKAGVYFFSLDAANPVAVWTARRWFHLPYFHSRMRCFPEGEGVCYQSRRIHMGDPGAELVARYRPTGEAKLSAPGSIEHFLTERYCLFTLGPEGGVFRVEIDHPRWPLQSAEAEFEQNTMHKCLGVELQQTPPLLQFARELNVKIRSPARSFPTGRSEVLGAQDQPTRERALLGSRQREG